MADTPPLSQTSARPVHSLIAVSSSPALSSQLESLYLFVEAEIRRASLERDASPLPGAREVLTTLLAGWKSVEAERT